MRAYQYQTSLCRFLLLSRVVGFCLVSFFVLTVFHQKAMADETGSDIKQLSAKAFAMLVKEGNPDLVLEKIRVELAAADMTDAKRRENPSIAYDREEIFDEGRGLSENQVSLAFPIEISRRRNLLVESAKEGVYAARSEVAAAQIDVISVGLKIYYRTAAWRQRLQLLETDKRVLSALLKTLGARLEEGDSSGYDLSRVELEVFTLNDRIAETQRELDRGRLLLGALVGDPGTSLGASDDLVLVTPSAFGTEIKPSRHPRVAAFEHRIASQNLKGDAAKRKQIPSLTLRGGMMTASEGDNTLLGYTGGIAMTLPFFDSGKAERERAAVEVKRNRAARNAAERQIGSDLAMAQVNLKHLLAQTKRFEEEQLPRVEKLVEIAEYSYREGERPVFELLDAYRTHRAMRLRHVYLLLNAQLSLIDLNTALGRVPGEKP